MMPTPDLNVTDKSGESLPPDTTRERDRVTAGQRRINILWELTQAAIALGITGAVIYCAANRISSQDLTNTFFLIVGFYFSRTNHSAVGGMGRKSTSEYTGR